MKISFSILTVNWYWVVYRDKIACYLYVDKADSNNNCKFLIIEIKIKSLRIWFKELEK